MQFKHPEILWALFFLLIPIIVHLFQLRRFKKTPFTNVAMLQKVISESRKSNRLKKWLLLLSRLLVLACLVIAFAQPFFAKNSALQEKETVIYLDDSFSMQAKKDGFTLLEEAVQDLVKSIPDESSFSLFTNTKTYKDIELKSIQNKLLTLDYGSKQLTYNEISLKAKTLFSNSSATQKNLILISDFQEQLGKPSRDSIQDILIHLVDLKPDNTTNISIDSLFLSNTKKDQIELNIVVSGISEDESIPISIFNESELIAKAAVDYNPGQKTTIPISLSKNEAIKGRVSITDDGLNYDNNFYFNIDKKDKIKVLAISEPDANFLGRIFTEEEFDLQNFELKNLNYSEIDSKNLVILNGLSEIPTSLQTVLNAFHQKGGSVVIIPSTQTNINTYNILLSSLLGLKLTAKNEQGQKITAIAFDHPLFENVFEKRVSNFDYPQVKSYWEINSNNAKILSLANGAPFLIGGNNVYLFTAALDEKNSNFKNAPLIVPTFYNIGVNSLKSPELYTIIGKNTTIEVAKKIEKDRVLKVTKPGIEFIPLQQSFSNKVSLTFTDNPEAAGIYSLMNASDTLKNLSFNFPRGESVLRYQTIADFKASTVKNSIPQVFEKLAKDNSITQYWKWFIIFAMVFALVEVLIQKFLA
ncbi:BatA domain-containing protein [uncultured Croceitalea sp.]|uniref:BatA domain-containing protein n=1 Tax=uncultured Croceitalea sp. TaxID=1798908 RepID=UPI0033068C22